MGLLPLLALGLGLGSGSLCPKLWPTKPVANQGHDKAAISASTSWVEWSPDGGVERLTSPVILASKQLKGNTCRMCLVLKAPLLLLRTTRYTTPIASIPGRRRNQALVSAIGLHQFSSACSNERQVLRRA